MHGYFLVAAQPARFVTSGTRRHSEGGGRNIRKPMEPQPEMSLHMERLWKSRGIGRDTPALLVALSSPFERRRSGLGGVGVGRQLGRWREEGSVDVVTSGASPPCTSRQCTRRRRMHAECDQGRWFGHPNRGSFGERSPWTRCHRLRHINSWTAD
jgi:hypothetical protein